MKTLNLIRERSVGGGSQRARTTMLIGLLLLLVIGQTACGGSDRALFAGPVDEVTLGVEKSLLPAAVWVADNKGFFEEEGLDLTIEEFASGKASLIALLNDEGIDIAAAAPTPIMFNSFSRDDFVVFSTFAFAWEDIKVIANKDRGINSVRDLKGKTIGTLMGSTGEFFTDAFLVVNSISPSDVEIVDMAPSDLPQALNSGRIDAQVIWEPHGTTARILLEDRAVRLPSSDVYKTTFNFLTMKSFAAENPEVLVKFLRAIIKATTLIHNQEEEAQKITANRLNLPKDVIAMHWADFTFDISLDQTMLINIESEARWAINNRLTDAQEVPNYLDYMYLDALEQVSPGAVTIIR